MVYMEHPSNDAREQRNKQCQSECTGFREQLLNETVRLLGSAEICDVPTVPSNHFLKCSYSCTDERMRTKLLERNRRQLNAIAIRTLRNGGERKEENRNERKGTHRRRHT